MSQTSIYSIVEFDWLKHKLDSIKHASMSYEFGDVEDLLVCENAECTGHSETCRNELFALFDIWIKHSGHKRVDEYNEDETLRRLARSVYKKNLIRVGFSIEYGQWPFRQTTRVRFGEISIEYSLVSQRPRRSIARKCFLAILKKMFNICEINDRPQTEPTANNPEISDCDFVDEIHNNIKKHIAASRLLKSMNDMQEKTASVDSTSDWKEFQVTQNHLRKDIDDKEATRYILGKSYWVNSKTKESVWNIPPVSHEKGTLTEGGVDIDVPSQSTANSTLVAPQTNSVEPVRKKCIFHKGQLVRIYIQSQSGKSAYHTVKIINIQASEGYRVQFVSSKTESVSGQQLDFIDFSSFRFSDILGAYVLSRNCKNGETDSAMTEKQREDESISTTLLALSKKEYESDNIGNAIVLVGIAIEKMTGQNEEIIAFANDLQKQKSEKEKSVDNLFAFAKTELENGNVKHAYVFVSTAKNVFQKYGLLMSHEFSEICHVVENKKQEMQKLKDTERKRLENEEDSSAKKTKHIAQVEEMQKLKDTSGKRPEENEANPPPNADMTDEMQKTKDVKGKRREEHEEDEEGQLTKKTKHVAQSEAITDQIQKLGKRIEDNEKNNDEVEGQVTVRDAAITLLSLGNRSNLLDSPIHYCPMDNDIFQEHLRTLENARLINSSMCLRILQLRDLLQKSHNDGVLTYSIPEEKENGNPSRCILGWSIMHVDNPTKLNKDIHEMIKENKQGIWRRMNGSVRKDGNFSSWPVYELLRRLGVSPKTRGPENEDPGKNDFCYYRSWFFNYEHFFRNRIRLAKGYDGHKTGYVKTKKENRNTTVVP